ncbi:hypothetical protein [Lusitaniella coriacea]|uniref:hypothetical protein n=1 Tax=Lusitaniella coriacea TaxID=1983105 RepID=UPI003CE8E123
MEKLYEYILNGIKSSRKFYDSRTKGSFENYLTSLQASVRELRNTYRSSYVDVDYSRPAIQAAYLIAYYPHYVEMNLEILRLLSSELSYDREIKACFFGAGPCPELVGLVQLLTERSLKTKRITVNAYDIASDTWTLSREITRKFIVPNLWRGRLTLNSQSLDFNRKKSFFVIQSNLQDCNLFIFQNCLNEIVERSVLLENVEFLINNISRGSFIIFADLLYKQNLIVFEAIGKMVSSRYDFEIFQERTLTITSSLRIPRAIANNLLTGKRGLIPRSKTNFMFLALRKSKKIRDNYDDIPF